MLRIQLGQLPARQASYPCIISSVPENYFISVSWICLVALNLNMISKFQLIVRIFPLTLHSPLMPSSWTQTDSQNMQMKAMVTMETGQMARQQHRETNCDRGEKMQREIWTSTFKQGEGRRKKERRFIFLSVLFLSFPQECGGGGI